MAIVTLRHFAGARHTALFACLAAALSAHAAHAPADLHDTRSTPSPLTADIVVTNCTDAGTGSLREAFTNALDGNVIGFDANLDCSVITLTTGAIATTAAHVTLQGHGADQLIVTAKYDDRVLSSAGSLDIRDITLAYGRRDPGLGGCLFVGGDLRLTRSTVTGCVAGDGNNVLARGGAIDVLGDLYMTSSTIEGGHARGSDSAMGGAAYVSGSATLIDSTIQGSDALGTTGNVRGGGLFAGGDVDIDGSRIIDNGASSMAGSAYGGGLYGNGYRIHAHGSSAIARNAVYSQSNHSYGGGISGGVAGTSLYAERILLSANSVIGDCASCSIGGGGAHTSGAMFVQYGSIVGNVVLAASGSAGYASGGGLQTNAAGDFGEIQLFDTTVSGNRVDGGNAFGGGIAAISGSRFLVANSTIAFNRAGTFGGGIIGSGSGGSVPVLSSSIVAENEAPLGADIGIGPPDFAFAIEGGHSLVRATQPGITLPADTRSEDPLLFPLANYGGAARMHALANCSVAIDNGSQEAFPLSFDQRGAPYMRAFGAGPDIGAFELQPDNERIFGDGFERLPTCPPG